ncbi:MAG TPA: glycosyltransferase [Candidatus Binataceae bacterium]|nr:glycosyltransferase [Candidatus Binataceae bacterium]
MDISVILPVVNERDNLRELIPRLHGVLGRMRLDYEIIVVDGGSTDGTGNVATSMGARVVPERQAGYAGALETGFAEARGDYLLTLDADLSHEPDFAAKLWRARNRADIIIASRYARGGTAYSGFMRNWLSRALNLWMRRLLSMPVRDMSSGFRLYRRAALANQRLDSRNFEVIEEILVKAYAQGYSVHEVAFTYFPRESGRSHARLFRFGLDLMRSSLRLRRLRNSILSADYDDRAFYSIIPLQRYWQRRRHRIATFWARGAQRVLDVGCGSSLIIQSLNNAVGMDFSMSKVRFLRRLDIPLLRGSAFALPFKGASFDCIISSQVIEHIPYDEVLFSEMYRVLRPGGRLIIGTPDYATLGWQIIEPLYGMFAPGGYRDEHITHYTRESLADILLRAGFAHEQTAYVFRSELIMLFRKPGEEQRVGAPEIGTGAGPTIPDSSTSRAGSV